MTWVVAFELPLLRHQNLPSLDIYNCSLVAHHPLRRTIEASLHPPRPAPAISNLVRFVVRFIVGNHHSRNAAVYGVENRIEFILGDAMKILPTLNADVVFLSPPWGGPAYQDSKTFDLKTMIPPPLSALEMFRAARKVTPNVVFFLPRNVDAAQVAGLPAAAATLEAGETPAANTFGVGFDDTCELEKQFLNGKLKTTTAYFGEDIAITVGKKKASKGSDASAGLDEGGGVIEPPLHQQGDGALNLSAYPNGSSDWYGDGGKEGATWSGRHVRFSDDGEGGGDEVATEVGNDGAPSISQERENALYDAWMTP